MSITAQIGENPTLAEAGAAAQRSVTRSVKEVREKLANTAGFKPEFEYELLMMFVRNELSAALTVPLLAVIVAIGAMFWAPVEQLVLWLGIVLIAKGILLSTCRQFARQPRSDDALKTWQSKIAAAEFLYGASWASVAFVSIDPNNESAVMFIFAALIVVISMRMLFAATATRIVYAGTLPITIALVVRLALLDSPFYWAMALMAIGVNLYFIILMKGFNETVLAMLEYRAEKDALIAEIEQAKSISDEGRRRAEEANFAKSRFLATMSHELRTPLNAIIGFSEVMKSEILGQHAVPTYREYASDIHDSGQHLLKLINEILDLSRIEAGRYELNEQPVVLGDVVEDCRRLIKLRAESKGLTLVENVTEKLSPIWADERAVRQICLNLLSNALKFTPTGGTITLTVAEREDGSQFLSVRDTGPGIPEKEIPRVLKTFGQGSLAHQTAEGGTGLGLNIVKGLVELHDGSFDLQSKLRVGTEVIIGFPKKRVMQALPRLREPGELPPTPSRPKRPSRKIDIRKHA